MCKDCVGVVKRFEGGRLIIEKRVCLCECLILYSNNQCEKCLCTVKVEEENENWEGLFRDRAGNPVPFEHVWTGQGQLQE
ncbi:MAG: hypothetical protein UT24_C0003G0035 [Candidatus Woesebacteria bacterium GW2011_GWB1_39_12]|uniref:Uncharacterized protein n=1 Tax=Candidatus Woesebacteria bacterium GW2011_GWB1_39_12 TaxID=1618574 RepID=A0A0G0MEM3_9BACT|nr:MAG: hypothetical protein UT24_C0003G0035 [Candidatus Woesebacteria bacterium GW2011_GWB1_39_12]